MYQDGMWHAHAIHWYATASNKYMKDYAENKKLSFPKYWDVNDLYGWTISKKLFVHGFK